MTTARAISPKVKLFKQHQLVLSTPIARQQRFIVRGYEAYGVHISVEHDLTLVLSSASLRSPALTRSYRPCSLWWRRDSTSSPVAYRNAAVGIRRSPPEFQSDEIQNSLLRIRTLHWALRARLGR